jgi:hypothetical protein
MYFFRGTLQVVFGLALIAVFDKFDQNNEIIIFKLKNYGL